MFGIFISLLAILLFLVLIFIEILNFCNKFLNEKEINRFEDSDFIWILRKNRWIKYDKNENLWVVLADPPFFK